MSLKGQVRKTIVLIFFHNVAGYVPIKLAVVTQQYGPISYRAGECKKTPPPLPVF